MTPERAGLFAIAAFVALLVLFSNHLDWDVFFTLSEVERRAWLLDHELPRWTYQLCGGMTRAGDPQAFGLSPLFLLVLAFGSFWGNKLVVLLSLAAGWFFTARILEHFHAPAPAVPRAPYAVLAALFVFGNYFMWHLLVGHLTFTSLLLALGIVFYTLEGYRRPLKRGELAIGALIAWQHYSGGFFHSLVYFLIPFFLAFALFVAVDALRELRRGAGAQRIAARLLGAGGFHLLGVALAGYKLWAVWDYFREVDRADVVPGEALTPAQAVLHLLVPTWRQAWSIGSPSKLFAIHEYSAFSLLAPLALVACAALARRSWPRAPASPRDASLTLFALLYLGVSLSFSLGAFARFAPFSLLETVANVRAIGRFHVGSVLALGMLLMRLLWRPSSARWLGPAPCLCLLAALGLNLASFLPLTSPERLREILSLPADSGSRMRGWQALELFSAVDPDEPGFELAFTQATPTYGFVLGGGAMATCYQALPLPPHAHVVVTPESIPLIDARFGAPSPACIEQSYFTQNRVVLGSDCPELTCTQVARANPRQPELVYSPEHDRFCRRRQAPR
jgi:hypothetical protein